MVRRRPFLGSSLPGRAARLDGRSGLSLNATLFLGLDDDRVLQIAGMSTPATERLKSSVRKAMPCGPMWCERSTES